MMKLTRIPTTRTLDDLWRGHAARYDSDTARPILRPAMDVVENEDGVTIYMDLPGLAAENVNVEIDGDLLTISGALGESSENDSERYHTRERCTGAFKRTLRLADTLDTDHVDALFENGVLRLSLPKRPELQPKRITVQVAS